MWDEYFLLLFFFFFKQKTAYEMRISDWSSDVCSSDLERVLPLLFEAGSRPELVYRHKVHNGDLVMWDNGCTMHRRDEMRLDQPRLMKRTTFRLSPEAYCAPH